jgi:hypothetical protein
MDGDLGTQLDVGLGHISWFEGCGPRFVFLCKTLLSLQAMVRKYINIIYFLFVLFLILT